MDNKISSSSLVELESTEVSNKKSSSSRKKSLTNHRSSKRSNRNVESSKKSSSNKRESNAPKTLVSSIDEVGNISIGENNSLSDGSLKDCVIIGKDAVATNNGQLVLGSQSHPVLSTHTIGKNGNANATPAAPEEYLIINFNGNLRKIPLYNP